MTAGPDSGGTTWLTLVLGEAPAAAFEEHRRRLHADASPAARALVDTEARRALQVKALLTDRRHHSAELTVLNDLASRLTAIRDPSALLKEVAMQARRLLSVDVAYIMLVGEDGALRILVVDGSIGSALRGIELPRGSGIGGRVVASGQPYWTADYLADQDLRHLDVVDTAAADERLAGILGVPLRVGEETIGALFAAERRPRPFADSEVSLLSSLASHAAIAIHNAQLFDQNRQTAQDLDRTNDMLRAVNAATQRGIELHDALMQTVLEGGGVTDVLSTLAAAVSAHVGLVDSARTVLASAPSPAPDEVDVVAAVRRANDAIGSARRAGRGGVEGRSWVAAPVPAGRKGFARLVLSRPHAFDEEAVHLVERGATVVALAMASERAVVEAERRAQGELIAMLLSGTGDEAAVRRRARSAGVDLQHIRSVVVLDGHGDAAGAARLAHRLAVAAAGWTGEYRGQQVALLPEPTSEVQTRLAELVGGTYPTNTGLAGCPGGVRGTARAYEAARDCVRLMAALGHGRGCANAEDFGIYRTLLATASRGELLRFVAATVGPVVEYDERRQRDLTRTLEAYLHSGRHHGDTAKNLNIHPNTLYQRLARIGELLGDGWRDPDRAFEIELALRLLRLTEHTEHTG